MTLPTGYSFKSKLSFAEIRTRLAELGHGDWKLRESGIYGEYIRGQLWGIEMRIYDGAGSVSEFGSYNPAGYMLLDYRASHRDGPTEAHDVRIREELFPTLGVTEWKPAQAND